MANINFYLSEPLESVFRAERRSLLPTFLTTLRDEQFGNEKKTSQTQTHYYTVKSREIC